MYFFLVRRDEEETGRRPKTGTPKKKKRAPLCASGTPTASPPPTLRPTRSFVAPGSTRGPDRGRGIACATHFSAVGPIRTSRAPTALNQTMAGAKKGATLLVKLLSTAGTGFFYVKRKNARTLPGKLQFVKYDPRVRRHVLFTETKLK